MLPFERESATYPDSNGSRNVCRARALNSGASSRNRMPRCARVIAPGTAMPLPPPTKAAVLAVWCGASNGGMSVMPY